MNSSSVEYSVVLEKYLRKDDEIEDAYYYSCNICRFLDFARKVNTISIIGM